MKKNYASIFLLLICNFFAAAQTPVFQRTFGGMNNEGAASVISTADRGYAIVGSTNSYGAGDYDVLLIKLDSIGNMQWSRVYGGTGNDQALSIVQTSDTGFAICGKTTSFGAGDFDVLLMKTNSSGIQQWMKTYGGVAEERALNFRQTSDHGFILAGSTISYGQGNFDMLFIKTDSVGDTLWTRIMGGSSSDQGTDADQTTDGGYIFSGRVSSWGSGSNDVYLAKMNSNGDTLWTRVFGGSNWDEGMKVKQTTDGGYIVTGGATSFTNGGYDAYLNKVDTNGLLTWSKLYAGPNTDATYDVLQLADGGYIMLGETDSYGPNHLKNIHPHSSGDPQRSIEPDAQPLGNDHANVYVIRTDVNGDTLWTSTYGGGLLDEALSLVQAPDKGFVIASYSTSFSSDSMKFYMIKTDSIGYTACNQSYAHPVVSTPPTVEMTTTTQITSGLIVTNVSGSISSIAPVLQNDICFAITGMSEPAPSSATIFIYPNPGSSEVTLVVPPQYRNFRDAEISVYDMYGRTIKKYVARAEEKIQLSVKNFSAGVYEINMLLTDKDENKKMTFTAKLLVQ